MKKLTLIISFTAMSCTLFAQKIKVTESYEMIGGGRHDALSVTIYEASQDVIEKEVKSLMKDYNAKVSSQDGGWFGDNASIKKMGENTVDMYAKWETIKDGEIRLVMAFDLGGDYISSSRHGKEYDVAKDMVQDFATRTTQDAIAAHVKAEQKTFDKLTDEEKRLEKENKSLNDAIADYTLKIQDYQQKIKKAQDDIEINKSNQGKKKEEEAFQQKTLEDAKSKEKIVN